MGSLEKGIQADYQGEQFMFPEGPRYPLPNRTDSTSCNHHDEAQLENCAHNDPIGSGIAIMASMIETDSQNSGSASRDHWWQGSSPESCPCLDFMQPVDHVERNSATSEPARSSTSLPGGSSHSIEKSLSRQSGVAIDIPSSGHKSTRFHPEAVKILRSWFYQHRDYPYPTDEEREILEQQTGLNRIQVLNWFTNARRRKLPRRHVENDLDQTLLSPMERWQHSPPESEPAMTADIIRAAENTPYYPSVDTSLQFNFAGTCSSNTSHSSHQFESPSISSYEHSHSSGSELSYHASRGSFERPSTPIPQMRARRHRRKMHRYSKRAGEKPAHERQKRPFQCTFCSNSFRTKYDWQRHEKALHLSVDRWTCAPEGGIAQINGVISCVFCLAPSPDIHHLETHNFIGCCEKPSEYRSFSRKDHLVQHLRLIHEVSFIPSMEKWRDSTAQLLSRCGFCDSQLFSWQERVDHIAEHFKSNADMDQWHGCWGFEPDIEELVENAMPPYLLGQERRSMDPWKAHDTVHQGNTLPAIDDTAPNALDRYDFVREKLTEFLRNEMLEGNYPSDSRIQDEARMIAYGNDDPWNQTYADDPAFIMCIRNDVGFELWTSINEQE